MIGIYCIKNIINNKKYIGYSTGIMGRWANHKSELRRHAHENDHLQKSYNKYGKDNFIYYVIEECSENKLLKKEKYYIKLYKTRDPEFGYNLNDGGVGSLHPREETLEKLRKRTMSQENKDKMSLRLKGVPKSEEWKVKVRGRKMTEENRIKLSKRSKGRPLSEKQKNDLSINQINKKRLCDKIPSSKYIGVSQSKEKWRAVIRVDRKGIGLGRFDTDVDAAIAYNKAYDFYYPDNVVPNNISCDEIKNSEILKNKILMERLKNKTSKYKGAHKDAKTQKWVAKIYFDKKVMNIGYFFTEIEAAMAYNQIAEEYFGHKAKLNIIPVQDIIDNWNCEIEGGIQK